MLAENYQANWSERRDQKNKKKYCGVEEASEENEYFLKQEDIWRW